MTRLFATKGKTKPPTRSPRGKILLRRFRQPLRLLRNLVILFFLATSGLTLLFGVLPTPITPLMIIRTAQQVTGDDPVRLSKDWTSLDNISPYIVEAVVAAEDQQFFTHRGFDFESIVSAFAINMNGKRKLGASTISQQTAKNLFLWPDRSWARKGLEAYFTFLMETLWTKRRILTVYLNVIETGNGIYGVEAASREYFGVPARKVTRSQAAMLAAVLPNPRRWSPDRPTPYLERRQAWILRQMDLRGSLEFSHNSSRIKWFFRKIFGGILKLF